MEVDLSDMWRQSNFKYICAKRLLGLPLLLLLNIFAFDPCLLAQDATGPIAHGDTQRPTVVDPTLFHVRTLIDSGRYAQADAELRQKLEQTPDSAGAHALLAFVLFREAKPQPSLDEYTRSAKLSQPTADDLRIVALDYVLLHDYEDAAKWMATSLALEGDNPEAWYEMGRIRYTQNRFQESVESFHRSLQLSPRSVKAENNLGLALEGLNRDEEAIAAYRQAMEWQEAATSPSEQPLINLSILLINREHFVEALPLLLRAKAIAPDDKRVHEQLARLYLKQEEFEKARQEMERAVQLSPDTAALHFQLGQIYKRLNLPDKARAEFARVGELMGNHSSPVN